MSQQQNQYGSIKLLMSSKEVGSIIGKGGEVIRKFREENQAKINISGDVSSLERVVTLQGNREAVHKALLFISYKMMESDWLLPSDENGDGKKLTIRLLMDFPQCESHIQWVTRSIDEMNKGDHGETTSIVSEDNRTVFTVGSNVEGVVSTVLNVDNIVNQLSSLNNNIILLDSVSPPDQIKSGEGGNERCFAGVSNISDQHNTTSRLLLENADPSRSCCTPSPSHFTSSTITVPPSSVAPGESNKPFPYVGRGEGSCWITNETTSDDKSIEQVISPVLAFHNVGSRVTKEVGGGVVGLIEDANNNLVTHHMYNTNPILNHPATLIDPAVFAAAALMSSVANASSYQHPNPAIPDIPQIIPSSQQSNQTTTSAVSSIFHPSFLSNTNSSTGGRGMTSTNCFDPLVPPPFHTQLPSASNIFTHSCFAPHSDNNVGSVANLARPITIGSDSSFNVIHNTVISSSPTSVPPVSSSCALMTPQTTATTGSQSQVTKEILVPNELIGCIIGKGGSKIAEIRQMSGAVIRISNCVEGESTGPYVNRTISVTGNPQSLTMAFYLIHMSIEIFKACNRSKTFNEIIYPDVTLLPLLAGTSSSSSPSHPAAYLHPVSPSLHQQQQSSTDATNVLLENVFQTVNSQSNTGCLNASSIMNDPKLMMNALMVAKGVVKSNSSVLSQQQLVDALNGSGGVTPYRQLSAPSTFYKRFSAVASSGIPSLKYAPY